jgi:hypothetical protein
MHLDISHPFTRSEALAAGISVNQLAGPRFARLFQGVYVSARVRVTPRLRAQAALKVTADGAWVSHHTAGLLWGGWMPETSETHITVPDGITRTQRRGILAHCARSGVRPARRYGLLVSRPADVFLDLAEVRVDLVDLVVAGDSLLRTKLITEEDLIAVAEAWPGKGGKLARRAARLVRLGVDSAPESRLRMLLVLAGLPEPQVNLILRGSNGEWRRRFDLSFPELKLLIEYDGRQHAEDSTQWSRDILRREELERQGWRIIVINSDALFGDPLGTLLRIQQALRDRNCPNLRHSFSTAWQRHFLTRQPAA